ncbi:hypothetical protein CPB85DRAFT_1564060 [Mucidula mucida]|nr:hypothetical protein CPB85DRAFT_1564060 [Mucidula mucida]
MIRPHAHPFSIATGLPSSRLLLAYLRSHLCSKGGLVTLLGRKRACTKLICSTGLPPALKSWIHPEADENVASSRDTVIPAIHAEQLPIHYRGRETG